MENKEEKNVIEKEINNENKEHKDIKNTKKEKHKEKTITVTEAQVEEVNKRLKEAEEKALRSNAELINYRKRKDEEVSRMMMFCNEGLIMDILPSLDNLERALNTSEDTKLKEGVNMIYKALRSTLEKYGVKEIEALDKKFDANLHQAVTTDSVKGKEEDIILEVLQKGYTLKDKVIRPAMVKVNK